MASSFNLNKYKQPGYFGFRYSTEDYRYYCDRIKQFYKEFNVEDDERYLKYLSLPNNEEKEQFLADVLTKKRNRKIDSILS